VRNEGAEEERLFDLSCAVDVPVPVVVVEERLSLGSEESSEDETILGMESGSESERIVVDSTEGGDEDEDEEDEEEKMEESAVADREKPLSDPVLKEGETEYRLSSGRRAK